MKKYLIPITICFLLLGVLSCKKDKDGVPDVAVDIYIDLNSYVYTNLNAVGGYVYVTGGYKNKGIIVYRRSIDEFKAYDRSCTYDPDNDCRLTVMTSGLEVWDSCCGSKYIITDGTPTNKPATLPMKAYQTILSGNTLHIVN
ncbi:MAG: hypothetical protein V2A54_02665 [Bacteroidota bacterium]